MKKIQLVITSITLAVLTAIFACNNDNRATSSETVAVISQDSLVKLGEYLVNTIGCDDCLSPKKMGPGGPEIDIDLRFSGHPASALLPPLNTTMLKTGWILFGMDVTTFAGPWGQSYAANISSDETGIGNWTEQQFFTALR